MNINVKLEGNAAAMRLLRELGEAPEGVAIWQGVGLKAGNLVKEHLYDRDAKPNKMGARKTHFYRKAAGSVGHVARRGSSEVQVKEQGVRQQWKGGVITPKKSKLLTIPLQAASRGMRANEFGDLFMLRRERGRRYGWLARQNGTGQLELMYALMRSVDQDPDESVMPSIGEMERAAGEGALLVLRKMLGSRKK